MEKLSLQSENLELVPPVAGDIDAIFAACQDPETQNWVPIPVPYLREHAVEYATTHTDTTWDAGTEFTWTIRTAGTLAGVVGLYRVGNGSADLGFWMDPAFRGKGLLTEACNTVLEFALAPAPDGLALARIGWNAYAGNFGSARVAQKLGFRFEGTARLGAALRGELRDDWAGSLLATDDRSVQQWSILA
ncbi:GNAT family N-acetyltransferase [Paeniglutamicibacter sp. R2-26]|uniref:GNAT family N-acetyltransferase n=1 Tax=Paeniglutamicibacter sp. R2-26 TaxID=3144417 RepID=UPI003EE71648